MFTTDYWDGVLIPWWQFAITIAIFFAVLAGIIVAITIYNKKKGEGFKFTTKDLTYGAVCLASSYALSFIPLFKMPFGGTVTPASILPIIIYCYFFGFRKSLVVSSAYMVLQLLQGPYIISPYSAMLDYLVPYTAICLVGLFRANMSKIDKIGDGTAIKSHANFFIGVAVYFVVRYFSHILAGVLFWSNLYDSTFMIWSGELSGIMAWTYSITYNGLFLIPDTLIAVIAGIFVLNSKSFNKFMVSSLADANANAMLSNNN